MPIIFSQNVVFNNDGQKFNIFSSNGCMYANVDGEDIISVARNLSDTYKTHTGIIIPYREFSENETLDYSLSFKLENGSFSNDDDYDSLYEKDLILLIYFHDYNSKKRLEKRYCLKDLRTFKDKYLTFVLEEIQFTKKYVVVKNTYL